MADRHRRRRLERKRLVKAPPLAVVRRRIVPPARPYEEMTTDEILADAMRRLWNIAGMQVADVERRFGMADPVRKAPRSLGDAGRPRPQT